MLPLFAAVAEISRRRVSVLFSPSIASSSRVSAWFKFGKAGFDAESAGIYGSQGREDYDRDDVEHVSLVPLVTRSTSTTSSNNMCAVSGYHVSRQWLSFFSTFRS